MAGRTAPARTTAGDNLTRLALWVYLLDAAIFGVLLLIVPAFTVETLAGSEGFEYAWLRPFGGVLLGLAWAAWQTIQTAAAQRTFLTLFWLASLLAGVGLLVGWIAGEYAGATWFLVVSLVATFGVAALVFVARSRME